MTALDVLVTATLAGAIAGLVRRVLAQVSERR